MCGSSISRKTIVSTRIWDVVAILSSPFTADDFIRPAAPGKREPFTLVSRSSSEVKASWSCLRELSVWRMEMRTTPDRKSPGALVRRPCPLAWLILDRSK